MEGYQKCQYYEKFLCELSKMSQFQPFKLSIEEIQISFTGVNKCQSLYFKLATQFVLFRSPQCPMCLFLHSFQNPALQNINLQPFCNNVSFIFHLIFDHQRVVRVKIKANKLYVELLDFKLNNIPFDDWFNYTVNKFFECLDLPRQFPLPTLELNYYEDLFNRLLKFDQEYIKLQETQTEEPTILDQDQNIFNIVKDRFKDVELHHSILPLEKVIQKIKPQFKMCIDDIFCDSDSVQSDIFEGMENKLIQDYTDISQQNKEYMCLWNSWIFKMVDNISFN